MTHIRPEVPPPQGPPPFEAVHAERTGTFLVRARAERVFPLLTPEGERLWVSGWDPEWLYAGQGPDRSDGVFRTSVQGEGTIWLILECDAAVRRARYLRLTPGSRVGIVEVACGGTADDDTEVTVSYRLTALSEEGNERLRAFTPGAFTTMLEEWRGAIAALLEAGREFDAPR